jgi:hypothetical protein
LLKINKEIAETCGSEEGETYRQDDVKIYKATRDINRQNKILIRLKHATRELVSEDINDGSKYFALGSPPSPFSPALHSGLVVPKSRSGYLPLPRIELHFPHRPTHNLVITFTKLHKRIINARKTKNTTAAYGRDCCRYKLLRVNCGITDRGSTSRYGSDICSLRRYYFVCCSDTGLQGTMYLTSPCYRSYGVPLYHEDSSLKFKTPGHKTLVHCAIYHVTKPMFPPYWSESVTLLCQYDIQIPNC